MTADMVNHPPHYSEHPDGLTAECIEYTRHMPFSQGPELPVSSGNSR